MIDKRIKIWPTILWQRQNEINIEQTVVLNILTKFLSDVALIIKIFVQEKSLFEHLFPYQAN